MDKKLLLKYIDGNCTDQEKVVVTHWIDSGPEHMKEYLALRKLNDLTIWQTPAGKEPIQITQRKKVSGSLKSIYAEVLKIAAIFVLAMIISRYVFPVRSNEKPVVMQTLHVPAGQRAEITLADGTKVWLNAKTTLNFPNQFAGNIREVKLDGEGYFEVTSNKSKPFIVKTEKYDVKVWGTKFNLMAYSGKGIFETSLFEGSVEVLKPGSTKGVLIHPLDRIFMDNDRLVLAPIGNMNHFLWKEGIISFDNESFPEMAIKLELYFDLKIEIKNKKILNYRCTGKFRTKDGVEHILKVLQLSNKFRYTINDKLNIIRIE